MEISHGTTLQDPHEIPMLTPLQMASSVST